MEKKQKKLLDFAGGYKYLTYIGCVLSAISAVIVLIPFVYIWKIGYEIIKVFPSIDQAANITHYGWMAVIFSVLGILVNSIGLMFTHLSAFRTASNMRTEALKHLVKLPMGYFNEVGSGKLRRVINESSANTETFLAHMLPDLVGVFVTPVAIVVLLFIFDWRFGLISLLPIAISMYFSSKMMGKELAQSMKEYQSALENMNNEAVEYIRGIPVVKTFGQSVYSFKSFHDSIIKFKQWAVDYTVSLRILMSSFTVSINSAFALLIPAAVLLIGSVANPEVFLSDFIFYVIFTPLITVMMNKIIFSSENIIIAKDATERINEILSVQPLEVKNSSKTVKNGDIKFENVSFTYNGAEKKAVNNVSLKINKGDTVALVGPSGGGKSTIVSLIPRFFDVDEGRVTIGNIDIREISNDKLMNMVSFVFQNNRLFKTSLLENIRFSKPNASREEVLKAVKLAQCEDIISKFPKGLDTVVGSKGVYLSGGEQQRIALARAILKDAPIIILDEATAFADPENEYMIQKAFEELTRGKTVLIVAHRLYSIKNSDKIFVINNGQIVESGSHDELLEKKEFYFKMWKTYEKSASWKVKGEYKNGEIS